MLQDVHITSAEGKMNVKTKNDISLQSSDGKLQVSNTGTDIDGGTINFNSGTVSVTDPTSARHDPLIVHNVPNTDTQYVFPYKTDARSVTANGKTIQLASIMKEYLYMKSGHCTKIKQEHLLLQIEQIENTLNQSMIKKQAMT